MTKRLLASLLFVCASALSLHAIAGDEEIVRFASLPKPGPGFPEGIAADASGRIFVSTFDFNQPNVIHVFQPNGSLATTIPLPGVLPLGLAFDDKGDLYVADFGSGNILVLKPPFHSRSSAERTLRVCGGAGAGCGLNAITFDSRGDLYVSDSLGGRVFKLDLPRGTVTTLASHDLLRPGSHGFPPFGANGLAFDAAEANLYIANTADDRILKYNVSTGELAVFAESVNGADGIAFDSSGRLWVAANQADELVALNENGRVIKRVGSFQGIAADFSPQGLLFPASIVISRGDIYVTNLALALTAAQGDEPEEDVKTYTVSRFRFPN